MKNYRKWKQLAGIAALPLLFGQAQGLELFSDDFTYADGSLTSQAAWTNHSGTALQMQVVSGAVVVSETGSLSEDANATFASQNSGTVYVGMDVSVADPGGVIAGGDYEYFAHFNSSGFRGQTDIGPPAGAGDYTIGIARASSAAEVSWGSDLTYGTTYRVVLGYDIDADLMRLWIDPIVIGDSSVVTPAGTPASSVLDAIAFRQSSSSSDETVTVDNLVVATTFGEVTGGPPAGFLFAAPGTVTLDETGGTSSETITVTLSAAPPTDPFTLTLSSDDTSEATVPATVDVTGFATSVMFDITVEDDDWPDGTKTPTISIAGTGFGSTTVDVTVNDDGDAGVPSASNLLITQYYEGSSNNKYIELTNLGGTPIDLSGFVLARWGNPGSEDWKVIGNTPTNQTALSGMLAGGASFVLANPSAASPVSADDADVTGEAAFFNGDDAVGLYTTVGFDPLDLVDMVMITASGFEGANTSFVRMNNFIGHDFVTGNSILDYDFVWQEVTTGAVDAAPIGDDEFIGTSDLGTSDPVLSFQTASVSVDEDDGTYDLIVTILNPDGNEVMVDVALDVSSTADAADLDGYTTQTVTFGAGAVNGDTQTVVVTLTDDVTEETAEDAIFVLQNVVTGGAAGVGVNDAFTMTIKGNDAFIPPIYISEIADPDDDASGRFVELYNPTALPVDLGAGNWNLVVYFNANTSGTSIALTGVIPAMGTYVIANSLVNHASLYPSYPAADQASGTINSNGDENFELRVGGGQATGTLVDIYGSPGTDGSGMPWEFADGRAVRNEVIMAPNSTFTAAEWTIVVNAANVADMTPGDIAITPTPAAGIEVLSLSIIPSTGAGSVTFTTISALFYDVQESDDAGNTDAWALVPGPYTETDNLDGTFTYDFTDPGATSASVRFYRLIEVP